MTPSYTGIVARDVVAGLLSAEGAQTVARAAVQEAATRGARVRFLQVVPPVADGQAQVPEVVEETNATFTASLRALREYPRVPVTFEVAEGDPGEVLVEHTADAGVLVLSASLPADLAAYCHRHAHCDVLTVRPVVAARLA